MICKIFGTLLVQESHNSAMLCKKKYFWNLKILVGTKSNLVGTNNNPRTSDYPRPNVWY